MPLTDTTIRNAKPRVKPYKLFDEKGLFLLVTPTGGKWWRLKYKFYSKEKLLSLGVYPDVSLKDARTRRDVARKLLAGDIDPSENRKVQKAVKVERAANSFEVVAREWYAKLAPNWSDAHRVRVIQLFERDVFPWIGGRPIADLKPLDLLTMARRIENRGALETAHRSLGNCGQVFRYAIAAGRVHGRCVASGRLLRQPTGTCR